MHDSSLPQPTERTLPPLLTQQARVARLCYDCGRVGQIIADDHTTLLCAKCWLERYEEARAC